MESSLQEIYDLLDKKYNEATNNDVCMGIYSALRGLEEAISAEENEEGPEVKSDFEEHNIWNKAQTGVK